jgi:ABC-type transport system involved in Fe-S cluster assembly fused permease/ATPase subunit
MLLKSWEWFNTRSHDVLLSRFVAEFLQLDEVLGQTLYILLQQLIKLHVVFIIILYQTYFTMPALILVYIMLIRALRQVSSGIRTARGVTSANQSFLIHSVIETHRGLTHFRNCTGVSYSKEGFMLANEVYQNSIMFHTNFADRWLCTRIHGYTMFVPFLVMLNEIIRVNILDYDKDPTWGIKMIFALDLVFTIQKLIGASISKETLATVMEILEGMILPDEWLNKRSTLALGVTPVSSVGGAQIKVEGLIVANPVTTVPLLREVSFTIASGEKVCIIGPKGSGKTTLVSAMLRLVEPCRVLSGQIQYDGRNIQSIPDTKLRKDLVYLPCKTILAPGNLRANLDPKRQHTDNDLIKILEYVGYIKLARIKMLNRERQGGSLKSSELDKYKSSMHILNHKIKTIRDSHNIILDFANDAPSFEVPHSVFKLKEHTYVESLKQSQKKGKRRHGAGSKDILAPIVEEGTVLHIPDERIDSQQASKLIAKGEKADEYMDDKASEVNFSEADDKFWPGVYQENPFEEKNKHEMKSPTSPNLPKGAYGLRLECCSFDSLEEEDEAMIPSDTIGYFAQSLHQNKQPYHRHTALNTLTNDAPLLLTTEQKTKFSDFEPPEDPSKLGNQLLYTPVFSSLAGLVAIARVLLAKPQILIVEADWSANERALIVRNWQDTTVIVVGESKEICEQWGAERCILIDNGQIVME